MGYMSLVTGKSKSGHHLGRILVPLAIPNGSDRTEIIWWSQISKRLLSGSSFVTLPPS
jgi:hypothetical protein